MSEKIIKFLEKEIANLKGINETLNIAAANNPFGEDINLAEVAEAYMEKGGQRVQVEIWQKYSIRVMERILKEVKEIK